MDDLQYNTVRWLLNLRKKIVLNLVINGWPSIPRPRKTLYKLWNEVLNLVINGWPSILI